MPEALATRSRHFIIGTAGHVDHGKTALIRALTGAETDRLREEQRLEGLRMTQQDIENRKIFNTHLYSQGNQGHDFTAVLNDAERRALIEYLKTL